MGGTEDMEDIGKKTTTEMEAGDGTPARVTSTDIQQEIEGCAGSINEGKGHVFKNRQTSWLMLAVVAAALFAFTEYRKSAAFQDRLECAASWLEKAKTLHNVEMKEPGNFTGDTMQKLMDSVDRAYDCATKKASHLIAPGGGSFGQHPVQPH